MIHKSCDVLPRIFSRRVTPENPRNRFSCYRTWAEQKDNENDKEHKHYFISTEALILFIHRNQWGNTVLFLPPDDWRLLQLIRIRLFSAAQWSSQWERSGGGDRVWLIRVSAAGNRCWTVVSSVFTKPPEIMEVFIEEMWSSHCSE